VGYGAVIYTDQLQRLTVAVGGRSHLILHHRTQLRAAMRSDASRRSVSAWHSSFHRYRLTDLSIVEIHSQLTGLPISSHPDKHRNESK